MTAAPLVSIVIPAYVATPHQCELLAETLDTVAAQSCQDFETVIVDDGSPLALEQVARRPSTTVLRQQNGGSEFLDADDHLLPPAIEAGLAAFEEHPECGFVVGAGRR